MAKLSISATAKMVGISRQHFYRKYINTGSITVETLANNTKKIDSSEILRVFGLNVGGDNLLHQQVTPSNTDITVDLVRLEAENEQLKQRLRDSIDRVRWLENHVDKLADQVTYSQKLIEHSPNPEELNRAKNEAKVAKLNQSVMADEARESITALRQEITNLRKKE